MKIKIYYRTGDSFSTEEKERVLDGEWRDETVAADNLSRIKEHYEYYKLCNGRSFLTRKRAQDARKPFEKADWMVDTTGKTDSDYLKQHCLMLKLDDGKEYQVGAFWCGYFEQLYGAEIVYGERMYM